MPDEPNDAINPETAIAVVRLLEDQLKMVADAFEGLERKASLLPPFLGAAVGLLLVGTPTTKYTTPQALLIGAGLAVSVGAGVCAIQSLVTRRVAMGPTSTEVAESIVRSLTEVNRATANAFAKAIIERLEVNKTKAKWFNAALSLTGIAMFLIALARVIGGL